MPKKTGSPTIRDVARMAGVSITTVSRALNQSAPPIAGETLTRIHRVIAELNFVPHTAARNLSSSRKHAIGLLLPQIGWDDYFPPLLRGVEAGAVENGFDLLIASRRFDAPSGRRAVGPHNTDGIAVFTDSLSDVEIKNLFSQKFPLVMLHRTPPENLPIPHIHFENKAGARSIVDHLIETHSRTRIVFLAGPSGNEDSFWREAGYRSALDAHGLPVNDHLIIPGNFEDADAQKAVESLLAANVPFDAIFAGDDDSAIGAITALHNAGKRVPEDISVVGFDDLPTARFCNPPLTTVSATIGEAGYQSTQLLAKLINGFEVEKMMLLPTRLVLRKSCGC